MRQKFGTKLLGIILAMIMLLALLPIISFGDNENARYLMDAETLSDGKIAVLFVKGGTVSGGITSGGALYYGVYNPANNDWVEEQVLGAATEAKEAALAIHNDAPHVAYVDTNDDIGYTFKDGDTWTAKVTIDSANANGSGVTSDKLYSPDIAVDENGKAYITYADTDGAGDYDIHKDDVMLTTNVSGNFQISVIESCTGTRDAGTDSDSIILPIRIDYSNGDYNIAYKILHYSTDSWGGRYSSYDLYFKQSATNSSLSVNGNEIIYEVCCDGTHYYTLAKDGTFRVYDSSTPIAATINQIDASIADMTLSNSNIYYATINGTTITLYQNGSIASGSATTSILTDNGRLATVISGGEQYVLYTGTDVDKSLVISKYDTSESQIVEYLVPNITTAIEANVANVDFGSLYINFSDEHSEAALQTVRITNSGNTTITIDNTNPSASGPFGCYWYDSTTEIAPGEYIDVQLRLVPGSGFSGTANTYNGNYVFTATNVEDDTDTFELTIPATVILSNPPTISTINITGLVMPEFNGVPDVSSITTDTTGITITSAVWKDDQAQEVAQFESNKTYTLTITFTYDTYNYALSNTYAVTKNGDWGEIGNKTTSSFDLTYTTPVTYRLTGNVESSGYIGYLKGTGTPDAQAAVFNDYSFLLNDVATLKARPATDYRFVKWQKDGVDYSTDAQIEVTITADVTYTAVFELDFVTVSFNSNGGSGTMAPQEFLAGTYELPANGFDAPEGKKFKCWSVGGVEKAVGTEITVSVDTVVTAVWEDKIAINTINLTGLVMPAFAAAADTTSIVTDTAGVTITSKVWKENSTPVDYFLSNKTYTLHIEFTIDEDDYVLSNSYAVTKNGDWGEVGNKAATSFDITYTTPMTYRLTVNTDGLGYVGYLKGTGNPEADANSCIDNSFLMNEVATLKAAPGEDYRFVKWTKDGVDYSTDAQIEVTITANVEYVAVFEYHVVVEQINIAGLVQPIPYEDVDLDEFEITTTGISLESVNWKDSNENVVESFEPNKTYTLHIVFSVDDYAELTSPYTLTTDATWEVSATKNATSIDITYTTPIVYTLTINTNGLGNVGYIKGTEGQIGANSTSIVDRTFESNSVATLLAVPSADYKFTKWTKDGADYSTDAQIEVTITADVEYVAYFELDLITITFNPGEGSGTMDPDESIRGKKYTLPSCTFDAPEGKAFKAWSVYGEEKRIQAKVTLDDDTEVTAIWQEKTAGGGGGGGGASRPSTQEDPEPVVEPTPVVTETILSYADEWAEEELHEAEEADLIPETFKDKDFSKPITRLDFAAVAVKLYEAITGEEVKLDENDANPFGDTDDIYVRKAYKLGITNGISDDEFGPTLELSREQMATMISRALKEAGIEIEVDLETIEKFIDDGDLSDWGRESVYFMAQMGIILGVGDNTFNALGNAKIEESLLIVLRSVNVFKK